MNPRIALSQRLGRKRPPGGRRPLPARLVQQAWQRAQSALRRLGLPLLEPGERLQLQAAARQGIEQYLRQVARIFAGSKRLQAALELLPQFPGDMAARRAHLLRIVEQAMELSALAARGEREAVADLRRAIDRLAETAEQLAEEDALPAEERGRLSRFAAFVRSFRLRAAQQAEAPRARGRRKVEKAAERAQARLRPLEAQRMAAALLGGDAALRGSDPAALRGSDPAVLGAGTAARGGATTAPAGAGRRAGGLVLGPPEAPPVVTVPRRRRSDQEVAPAGAPIEDCLGADVAEYAESADALDEILGQLGPQDGAEESAAGPAVDALSEGDLGVLVARLLCDLPQLASAAEVTAEDLGELLDRQEACAGLAKVAGLLLRGARDGALVCGELVRMVAEESLAALDDDGEDDEEAAALRQALQDAQAVLERSAAGGEAVLLRAERRIAEIDAEAEAALAEDAYARTVAQAAAGKPVEAERLEAALRFKEQQAQPAPAPAARRPQARKRPR